MSTETTNKKIKIDNGTTFGRTYTDKAVDERLQGLVNTATFTPVKEKANNSLQKPAGLTKTELVGVGANGQEHIEIGDNLTLANGKLSATGGSSGGGSGFTKYKIGHRQTIVDGTSGEHTYTIGERVGWRNEYPTPPSDFNDGVCVLLGTSCGDSSVVMSAVNKLSTISGDSIYYITGAKISKINGKYFIELGAYTINSGTATMGNSITSFASVTYAWIYK